MRTARPDRLNLLRICDSREEEQDENQAQVDNDNEEEELIRLSFSYVYKNKYYYAGRHSVSSTCRIKFISKKYFIFKILNIKKVHFFLKVNSIVFHLMKELKDCVLCGAILLTLAGQDCILFI